MIRGQKRTNARARPAANQTCLSISSEGRQESVSQAPSAAKEHTAPKAARDADGVDVSFVAIGYNESATLGACLKSLKNAVLPASVASELIYVDGGSNDDSMAIAQTHGAGSVLGGDRRRTAAENRNLGLAAARGRYIQFVDGDMVMEPDWPAAALVFLEHHPETAAVCGNLLESQTGAFSKAFEIDWAPREGAVRHCGGAAMFRRDLLERLGGFPEDVAYGEEPYLCWRMRNELAATIYQLGRPMARHELGYRGIIDYWRRNVRMGATYAEIAARCRRGPERLWLKESLMNAVLAAVGVAGIAALIWGNWWLRGAVTASAVAIAARKFVQIIAAGNAPSVAAAYTIHTYGSKVPLVVGELRWLASRFGRRRSN